MRAAIDWSYQFLDPQEQALFSRLAVFSGGFNLELAERLAHGRAAGGPYPQNDGYGERVSERLPFVGDPYLFGTEIGDYSLAVALSPLDGNVGEQLESLADRHLLQHITGRDGSSRYLMLETIRAYGFEKLECRGESAAVRHAHAAALMAFSEYSAPLVWSSLAAPWSIARVDDELGNLRAAIAWAESHGAAGAELVVRTVEPIWQYFQYRGMLSDVRHWLETAFTFSTIPPFPRASACGWLGLVCWIQGDDVAASRAADEALALGRRFDFEICEARAFVPTAAALAWRMGDLQEMASCIERALPIYQAWQDPIGSGICFFLQGQLLRMLRKPIEAREALEQAFALTSAAGYGWGMATARYYAAEAMHDQGDLDASVKLLVEALDLYWTDEDGWGAASIVSSAAVIAAERNDPERSARFFGIAATLLSRAGAFLPPSQLVEYSAAEERVRGILGEASFSAAFQAGLTLDPGHGVAEVRRHLAGVQPPASPPVPVPPTGPNLPPLTKRQHEIVVLLLQSKSPKAIARELGIVNTTVYLHISDACERWGVSSKEELVLVAERSGLF
jgi:DNA-binding CsgD family transcriptional regulator/tetratricopeptide (TPR) repeat protein